MNPTIVRKETVSNFGSAVVKSEGEWVAYDNVVPSHERYVIYPDNLETVSNEAIHAAKSLQDK